MDTLPLERVSVPAGERSQPPSRRSGKTLLLFAVLLPALLAFTGLIIDGGLLMAAQRHAQHVADAAATAAALEKHRGESDSTAAAAATNLVHAHNGLPDAQVVVNIPPAQGPYAGRSGYVEVVLAHDVPTYLMQVLGAASSSTVRAQAVAGYEPSTAGAAIVVLDPDPPPLSVSPIPPLLPAAPALLGGFEVLGQGELRVEAAVLVNTQWGGVDQNGDPAGDGPGPPYAIACTPLLPLTQLRALDIRVVGGVDNPNNYGHISPQQDSPLKANKLPVPDPFRNLPPPTLTTDPSNVRADIYGGVTVANLPLAPPRVLQPGVYDWIEVISGRVIFSPGIYVIRGANPLTQAALSIVGGNVTAQGVMFYITNSPAYSINDGSPDSLDGETAPPAPGAAALLPSVILNLSLLNSTFSPLNDPTSPFHGMTIYQRRRDRRPIIILREDLLLAGSFSGTAYAKWGHVILAGSGTFDARFVAGTMRVVNATNVTLAPGTLLPPAEDVFLVQ
ncbi:MAG: hypothetical protein HY000_15555 [Planctomycetes bacterium]|nr:hypothetical protein [Planctomycetota bacterium]